MGTVRVQKICPFKLKPGGASPLIMVGDTLQTKDGVACEGSMCQWFVATAVNAEGIVTGGACAIALLPTALQHLSTLATLAGVKAGLLEAAEKSAESESEAPIESQPTI